jgi:hypothetical protein
MKISKHEQNDVQTSDSVKKQLTILFSNFGVGLPQYNKFRQFSHLFWERVQSGTEMMKRMTDLISLFNENLDKTVDNKRKIGAIPILGAVAYLSVVETVGDLYANLAILLLTAKGIDFHLEPDYDHRYTRHAQSLEEIELPTIPLSTKLDFLKLNGLPFFSSWIHKNLRNAIAHMSFKIEDNGDFIAIMRGKRKKIDLKQEIDTFARYYLIVQKFFLEQMQSVRIEKP